MFVNLYWIDVVHLDVGQGCWSRLVLGYIGKRYSV